MLSLPKHLPGSLTWYIEQARLQGGIQNAEMASGKDCHSPWHLLYCLKSSSGHLFLFLTSFPTLFPSLFYQALATLVLLRFLELPSTNMFPAQGLRTCHSLCLECSSPKYQHGLFFHCIQVAAQIPPPQMLFCCQSNSLLCFLPSTHHLTLYQTVAYLWSLQESRNFVCYVHSLLCLQCLEQFSHIVDETYVIA